MAKPVVTEDDSYVNSMEDVENLNNAYRLMALLQAATSTGTTNNTSVDDQVLNEENIGDVVVDQGDTYYVPGYGSVEIDDQGNWQLNAEQQREAFKAFLRDKVGDHSGIDQFTDIFLGSKTTAPRGAPPTTLRDWAIQQQLDNILIDRGLLDRGTLERTSEVSTGGLASFPGGGSSGVQAIPQLDAQLTSGLSVLDSLGELGNLSLPDIGINDLNLPEVGVGDLGLPGVGIGDLNLPNLNVSDLNLPGVGVGDLRLPNLNVSDLNLPDVNVSDLNLPGIGVNDLSIPNLSVSDLGLPGVNVSDLNLPGVGVGDLNLPNVGIPDLGLPGVGVSDLNLPGVSVSDLNLPGVSVSDLGLPNVGVGDLSLPSVGVRDLNLPGVGVSDLNLPGVGISDLDLPNVTLADLGLPNVTLADLGLPNINLAALGLPDISVADLNIPSLAGLTSNINLLEQRLRTLNLPSLEALTTGIEGLESGIGNINFSGLLDAISGAESRIGALDVPSLFNLTNTLSDLASAAQGINIPDLTALNEAIGGLNIPSLMPLTNALSDLTTGVQGIGLPDFSGLTPADLGLSLPNWSGLTPADLGLDLSGFTPDPGGVGGDVYNEYVTNVTGGGGFDPITFGQGLAGAGPEGYDYLNKGFIDLLKQAQAQGIVGPGGGGGLSPDALRSGLGQFFFGSGWDQLAPTIDPERGIWDDLLPFGAAPDLTAFTDWGNQFRTGLGLGPGQTMQDLISGLIPAQPELDPAFTNPNLFFEGLTKALVDAYGATTPTFTDGSTAPTSWYAGTVPAAGTTPPTKPPVYEIPLPPALEMPAIPDFREYLQYPLMEGLTGALGDNVDFGVNPYDVRRDAILEGPTSAINEQFDEARENLINRFGTMGMTGSPAFSEQLRKLERDRAQQVSNIASQFGLAAAAQDEPIRRGRLQDLAGGLRGERDFVRDELKFQTDLDALQKGQYDQFITSQIANWMAPLNYDDEGKRLALGGIGSNVNPNIGGALGALGNIFAAAGNQIGSNNQSLYGMFGGSGGQNSLWGS